MGRFNLPDTYFEPLSGVSGDLKGHAGQPSIF
jgi:hypothetical protein